MKVTALTLLILQINKAIDSGKYDDVSLDEIRDHIDDGSILGFLRKRCGQDVDLSIHLDTNTYGDFEGYYVEQLQGICGAYAGRERKKWGVQNRGLCLLLAWTNELVQQGTDLDW